jgi:hypothetical protein
MRPQPNVVTSSVELLEIIPLHQPRLLMQSPDCNGSRGPIQFGAPAAGTLKVLVAGKQHMAALFADEPLWPLPHRPELIAQKTIRATHHLLSHFTPPLVTDNLSFGAS